MTEQTQTSNVTSSGQGGTDKKPDIIRVEGMHKWYGDFHVLKDLNLTVAQGERIVICGPSGSGKSTLVRMMCGLLSPSAGSVDAIPGT